MKKTANNQIDNLIDEAVKGVQTASTSLEQLNASQIVNPTTEMANMPPAQKSQLELQFLQDSLTKVQQMSETMTQLTTNIQNIQTKIQLNINQTTQAEQTANTAPAQNSNAQGSPMNTANKKVYNLSKVSQQLNTSPLAEGQGFNTPVEPSGELGMEPINDNSGFEDNASDTLEFPTANELKSWLEEQGNDRVESEQTLRELVSEGQRDQLASMLEDFFENTDTEQTKLEAASAIWHLLPDIVKPRSSEISEDVMDAPYTQASVTSFVKDVEQDIKKLAQKDVKAKTTKVFNLTKCAQSKSIENVIMWGPESTRIDPFLRQPASDWHVVERNKGFGLVLDDVWNTDWESVWRSTIMDKYSQPYRDKEGNWVGGYVQKRFEVDKWIPEESNMQLKPGQRRKPYLPEYRSLEARMEVMREKAAKTNTYGPASAGEATDWHTASKKIYNLKKASTNLTKEAFRDVIVNSPEDVENMPYGSYSKISRGVAIKLVNAFLPNRKPPLPKVGYEFVLKQTDDSKVYLANKAGTLELRSHYIGDNFSTENSNKTPSLVPQIPTGDDKKASNGVYNLKQAESKKKSERLAQIQPYKSPFDSRPRKIPFFDEEKPLKPAYQCAICGNAWKVDDKTMMPADSCECGANSSNKVPVQRKDSPDKPKNIVAKKLPKKTDCGLGPCLSEEVKMMSGPTKSGTGGLFTANDLLPNKGKQQNKKIITDPDSDNNDEVENAADALGIDG